MKPRGKHPVKKLSPAAVRNKNKPGRYADGEGLYLVVDPSGAKRWVLRTVVHGKRRDMGLGGVSSVTLAEARDVAADYRKEARAGRDPFTLRARQTAPIPTFEEAAKNVHEAHKSGWRNKKHADQWINTLAEYAFPKIGSVRVDHVGSSHVLDVLALIWLTKPETARRVRQRIKAVLDWAKAKQFRSGENPVVGIERALPKQTDDREHHAALPYTEVPAFVRALRAFQVEEQTKLAFEFLVLTAARTSEVLHAKWPELDLTKRVWTIPKERMKARRQHQVPLSHRCVELLKRAREIGHGSPYVFPGRKAERPLSSMALLMVLRRMERPVTVHGFRSSFRDWAAERTNVPGIVCEMALAHRLNDKTQEAYFRSDLFERRKELMNTWAAFATKSGKVINLRAAV